MITQLDSILLSENVVDNFYNTYNNDKLFKKWLDSVLPEIKMCELQQQNNPWHKYNVLGHILHSVEAINNQTTNLPDNDRRLLSYTMLLHDIGKPACHIVRKKDGKMIDSFFNHNIESAKVARRTAHDLGFDSNDAKILEKLVFKHDIFMFIRDYPTDNPHWRQLTPALIEEEIADLNTVGDGYKLMRYLVMVGRADSLAQNEKMTAESLRLTDKFDTMLDEMKSENI